MAINEQDCLSPKIDNLAEAPRRKKSGASITVSNNALNVDIPITAGTP